jgi:hypothetical protein
MNIPRVEWNIDADFFGVEGEYRLLHETLDECLEDYLDNYDDGIEEVIHQGVTIETWKRMKFDVQAETEERLTSFVMEMAEEIAEEYGDPDGGWYGGISTQDAREFQEAVEPRLKKLLSTVVPWRCEIVGTRTFTSEELRAWVMQNNPEWLEVGVSLRTPQKRVIEHAY